MRVPNLVFCHCCCISFLESQQIFLNIFVRQLNLTNAEKCVILIVETIQFKTSLVGFLKSKFY
jgi:hypothetical protein